MKWSVILLLAGCAQQFGLKPIADPKDAGGSADGAPLPDAPSTHGWTQVGAGIDQSCALSFDGRIYCLVSGTLTQVPAPAGPWTALSVGQHSACGLSGAQAYCWGDNTSGEAKPGSTTPVASSAPNHVVVAAQQIDQVVVGGFHACARSGMSVFCWGNGQQIGGSSGGPFSMQGSFTQISAGYDHTCGIDGDGKVYCWGGDTHSETTGVVPHVNIFEAQPRQVMLTNAASTVVAGTLASCALIKPSQVQIVCWGDGQAILASSNSAVTPTSVTDPSDWTGIALGNNVACGLREGQAECWGQPSNGGLGDGNVSEPAVAPTGARVIHQLSTVSIVQSGVPSSQENAVGLGDGSASMWGPPATLVPFPDPP